MLGNFYPSIIKDQMYDFMSDYKIATDVYKYKLTDGIYPFCEKRILISNFVAQIGLI